MRNLNDAIQFILGLEINSLSSVDQSIPKQLLPELIKYLLEQRFNDKEKAKITSQQHKDVKIQLQQQKKNILKQEQYIVTLKEQIQNLKYFITQKDQDHQKRYVMLSESSHSRIEQLIQDLQKQKDNTSQLRNLQKQMRQKCVYIKKLQLNLEKSAEQIQYLRNLRVKNETLGEQISKIKLKLALCQKSERNIQIENEELREKLSKVQEQNQQLQYIINNQISKVKQLTNEYFGSSKSNLQINQPETLTENQIQKLNLKHLQKQQNANYLKKVQQSFINEYLMEIKAFSSYSTKNIGYNKEETNQKNDMEFQFSLEKASQSLHEKQIESSSKSKGFNDYFMNINLNESKSIDNRKQSNEDAAFSKEKMNNEYKEQQIFPLSMKKEIKLDESQIKVLEMQKILERKVMESQNIGEEQSKVLIFSRDISRILQTKSKQIENLNQKLVKSEARNNEIEKQLQQLDRSRMKQIKMFEEEIYSEIDKIERLNNELKQESIKNVQLSRKQQFYSNQISDLQKLCASYENAAIQKQNQIQNEKNAVAQLSRRILEIEQQKWANLQTKNILKLDCSVQTIKIDLGKTPIECIHIDSRQNNQHEKQANTEPLANTKIITKQYRMCNSMTAEVKKNKNIPKMQSIKIVDLIIGNRLKVQQKLDPQVWNLLINTPSLCMAEKSIQATEKKVLKKCEQKLIQVVDHHKEIDKSYENDNKLNLWNHWQNTEREKGIKKFVPTLLQQQMIEQLQLSAQKRKQKNMVYSQIQLEQTLYYSVCEQNELAFKKQQEKNGNITLNQRHKDQLLSKQEEAQSNSIKEINQLLKIKQILDGSSKMLNKFEMKALPDISKLEFSKSKKICDIIANFRDPKHCGEIKKERQKGKNFYLVSGLVEKNSQLTTDRMLIWKEGIISLKLQKYLIMAQKKKFIHDPVDCILGNCQVIIHLHDEAIEVKRKEKNNYFFGNMEDYYWKVLEVIGVGCF